MAAVGRVSHVPGDRSEVTDQRPSAALTRDATTLHASIMGLQRGAGNRAVGGLLRSPRARVVQRKVGWTGASTEGHGWNVDERPVGAVRRIPLEGLQEGLRQESATRHEKRESTKIKELSPESAMGRAIVLVPKALDAEQKIEVVVFLHGFSEHDGRPFAGWRTFAPPPPPPDKDKVKVKAKKTKAEERLERLRHGIDVDDVAPVRDVALDQAEQQLEENGQTQVVIVLPQGGLHSQFGTAGDTNFDSGAYVREIVSRLLSEGAWKDAHGNAVKKKAPEVGRVSMAGHSGAGATLANMARRSVAEAAVPAANKGAKKRGGNAVEKPARSSTLTGDLVLFDAIDSSELGAFQQWALMRLNQDLPVLKALAASKDPTSEAEGLEYLRKAQKLRGYTSDVGYEPTYDALNKTIDRWFDEHAGELGPFAPCLRANFTFVHIGGDHEELMRGVEAGQDRAGAGTIRDALQALHPEMRTTADCPPMPASAPGAKRKRR
jgi:hypothetical protein